MSDIFSRTQLIFGEEAMEILANSRVAVFGVGGVGGYTVEALARSGVGAIDLIDDDKVCVTNINRQIIALGSTVGMYKVDAAEKRIHDINPECTVTCHKMFYMPETADKLDFLQYDYVVDAIDTVTGKIEIIMQAKAAGVPVISSMGAGNKVDPTAFEVADIYKTSVCPLARVMRYQLKRRGVKKLKVVYSKEQPIVPQGKAAEDGSGNTDMRTGAARRSTPGSNAFVPSVAGLIIGGEVIKDLIRLKKQ
ncbi:tRNA threonylcarbamoyladenosine dehydratase [Ruminococcus flavefaciens]|uniref:tRNA A37 threonylcarbamoyladenosine dehydratase n=1 Tax=Ruminococcus flavefaciens TaxID=1265 RepID=A0A315XSS2_RUMFL|nr:tRNA threonylcarbamoyladenosine dehydratase [Ruminococcus flavefaciens]PWJ09749.1 tRNA A37 threonylcarbamoyladenosine dehydratase [Ruminococcus flavefaciens]SSA52248.1 tRNA A37 threonylcarbamoyladenosine dehydratase [Ruminococcus flavefaciens]